MADRDSALRGLAEISEYMSNKADIAAIGKGKEVFDSWYRATEDALALLREQDTVEHALNVLRAHGWKDETEVTGDD